MEDVGATTKAVPDVVLSSGHKMPLIGFGTATVPPLPTEALIAVLVDAIEAGYRHIDTAEVYGSEEALGKAMAQALERGVIKSRDEVFITSKVWPTHANRDLILPALKESLRRLELDYVDLYLIHLPVRLTEETIDYNITKESVLEFDIRGTWEAMEECCNLGFAKSIGVSNFGPKKLSRILEFCIIPPVVNQVEMNVGWQQEKLRDCCRENRIHVSAWSPLAANGAIWGSMAVMESPILKSIAEARGTTVAQFPVRLMEKTVDYNITKENVLEFDIKGTWIAMEECFKLGLAKSIGVSNFGPKKLSRILEFCTIPPAVNQVEMNFGWKQEKLRDYCREKGIHVSAWSPLAANGAAWGSMAVMESPILKSIAEARGTTVAHVALRWVYDRGASVIVKSYKRERMRDNLKIFEGKSKLTGEEIEKIKQIPQSRGFTGIMFVVEGSLGYKSLDELWE